VDFVKKNGAKLTVLRQKAVKLGTQKNSYDSQNANFYKMFFFLF
jgi:hypothetical protein